MTSGRIIQNPSPIQLQRSVGRVGLGVRKITGLFEKSHQRRYVQLVLITANQLYFKEYRKKNSCKFGEDSFILHDF